MTETLSHYTDTIRDYCDTSGLLLQATIRIDAHRKRAQAGRWDSADLSLFIVLKVLSTVEEYLIDASRLIHHISELSGRILP